MPLRQDAGPSLLLIDDDLDLCGLMREYLTQQGCQVEVAHDGASGLSAALKGSFDVVILDVMMPVLDGFDVLRQLRQRSVVSIIMLTARTGDDDRITGLEAGADDYLAKPFNPRELLARVRAILRRSGTTWQQPAVLVEASGVRLSSQQRQAWHDGELLPLTSAEFDILDVLMRSAGRVVSRDQIAAALHQREASPYERSVDVHISHLRKKLQSAGVDPIRTVRGTGYLFQRE